MHEKPYEQFASPTTLSFKAMNSITTTVEQEEPDVQPIGHSCSSNSSVASGFVSSRSGRVSWGYSIFATGLSAKLPGSVEDIRETHRRRVNRHTAPAEQPRFVILGNTESASVAVQDFQKSGMGPHYIIPKDGACIRLVKEEYMAWCYNFAFWKSKEIGEPEDPELQRLKGGVGRINELKSYAVSIVLEGDGRKPYHDSQYNELVKLLTDIKNGWAEHGGLPPWNVLSAAEVEQPPPPPASPGESFDWKKLEKAGFSLKVEKCKPTSTLQGEAFKDALEEALRNWGYEFDCKASNEPLINRVRAFRQRYVRGRQGDPFEFSTSDLGTVNELLRLRAESSQVDA